MLAEQAQPAQVTRQSTLSRARPAVIASLAAVAPLAVHAIVGAAKRWLDERNVAKRTGGGAESECGGGEGRGNGKM